MLLILVAVLSNMMCCTAGSLSLSCVGRNTEVEKREGTKIVEELMCFPSSVGINKPNPTLCKTHTHTLEPQLLIEHLYYIKLQFIFSPSNTAD